MCRSGYLDQQEVANLCNELGKKLSGKELQVGRSLQLQSLWRIPTAAVS